MKLFAINSDGTKNRLLVEVCCQNSGGLINPPAISRDGSKVAFGFLRALVTPPVPDAARTRIGIVDTNGSGIVTITPPSGAPVAVVAIKQDSSQVAFTTLSNPTSIY